MQLYLLRHGIAEDARAGSPDSERALTPEGVRKLREVLKLARSAGVQPSLIVASPFKRAQQTAAIAAEVLGCEKSTEVSGSLTPMSSPEDAWQEIRTHRPETALLLASHEPLMGRLTAHLLGAPELEVDFKKGTLVRIDMGSFSARPKGVLKWMLSPKLAL